ncbi:MAG TPA: polysaccharide deacetylase family protein [Cellvibrio sp.]|nr:polysaccharide deacetylase family protein [Cellvibrio sp.]
MFGIMGKSAFKINFACLVLALLYALPVSAFSGKIALTFDDAPTPDSAILTGQERSRKIVAALQGNRIKDALFFVKGDAINAGNKNRLKLYTDSGYHLANHSFSHQSANELPVNDFLVDAYRAQLSLNEFANVLPYFRFPYLHYGKDLAAVNALQKGLADLGYKDGFVTIDNYDWYMNSILVKAVEQGEKVDYKKARDIYIKVIWDAIVFFDDIALQATGKSPSHILLLHENDTTALFLDDLIKHIKKNGGSIISPQEAYADSLYTVFPQTAFQKQGRIAAIAESKGVQPETLRHPAENGEYLDKLFRENKVVRK